MVKSKLLIVVATIFLNISTLSGFNHKPRVAICYFGLTRATKKVYKSHFEQLFDVLEANQIEYDVFMHTWYLEGKQYVWSDTIDAPIDYYEYKLLKPRYYKIDSQDDFTEQLDFGKYFYEDAWQKRGDNRDGEWWPRLILNHLCALESQKRVTDMVIETGNDYDLIMYIRPDVQLKTKFNINWFLVLQPGEIMIPNFHHFEGYNDRFAILAYETAPLYGKRIGGIADFRKNHGRIVSEKYVKFICDTNNLKTRFIPFYFDIIRP